MNWNYLQEFITFHSGKIIGITIGLLFGILVLTIGFWQTVFLSCCTGIGYWVGGMSNRKERLLSLLDRILPAGWR